MTTINLIKELNAKIDNFEKKLEEQKELLQKLISVNNLLIKEIIIKKISSKNNIPDGYRLLTYDEANRHIDKIKPLLDEWDICKITKPYLVNGSGYGYRVYESNIEGYNNTGHKLIINT